MGSEVNLKSISSKGDDIAQWRASNLCKCGKQFHKVQRISWKALPLEGQGWTITARVLTFGIDYHHDVIELQMKCTECHHIYYLTLQFGGSGKSYRLGSFQRIKKLRRQPYLPRGLFLTGAEEIYKEMPSSGYDWDRFNCQNWAQNLWNKYLYK